MSRSATVPAAALSLPQDRAADDMASFATVVSHDFSGPLRAIRGFANLLRDTPRNGIDDEGQGYLGEIISAAERMQGLNDGLVTCVRARSAQLAFTDVHLDAVFSDCVAALGPRIVELGARVTASPLPAVRADAAAIRLVLQHLLDNALRYADPGKVPKITVAATRGKTEWTFAVRDNGPGIAEISQERVFVMFKRLEPAREPLSPGVGLTLCRTLVERHGGRLWIDAAPGGGTEVSFTLPMRTPSTDGSESDGIAVDAHRAALIGPSQLLESNAALAAIVEGSDDAIFSEDLDGFIVTWNRAAERLYGFSAAEAVGEHVAMLMPPARLDELPTLLEGIRTGTRRQVETVRMRKDGSLLDVSLTVSPIRDVKGGIVAASVIARDITERHRSDEQLLAFLEVAPDAIVVIERTGAINAVNAQAEAIFGYTRDELVGQPLEMLLPERFRDGHVVHRLAFTAKPKTRPMGAGLALFALRRDGTEFPVDIQLSSLATKDGTLPVAAIRDVTERRRLEHLRDDFIGNAAHELRTPLTTLAGLGETLARSYDVMDRADRDEAFAAMARQGERARILIANLLDLSNIEGGRADFVIADVEISPLVARVLESTPPPDGKKLTVDMPPGLTVRFDAGRLEQVITNLLVNSYRYGGTEIRIDAHAEDDRVILSVADNGAGIAPDYVAALFEPFTRGKQANVVRGSGIGLALCRRVVESMAGAIWYEALLPHGSTFRVSLRSPS